MKPEIKPNLAGEQVEGALKRALVSLRVFLMATFVLVPLALSAADNSDASLTTSIFAPESTPAHSIMRLSLFVLAITGVIFVVVLSLIVYASVRFRRRPEDDGKEPARIYASNPV